MRKLLKPILIIFILSIIIQFFAPVAFADSTYNQQIISAQKVRNKQFPRKL